MVANLLANTIKALEQFEIAKTYEWTDSSVCLHWIQGDGAYKQSVTNRLRKRSQKRALNGDMCPHWITLQILGADVLPVFSGMTSGWWVHPG